MPKQFDEKPEQMDFTEPSRVPPHFHPQPQNIPPRAQVTGLNPNPVPEQMDPPVVNIPKGPARLHRTTFEYLKPSDEQMRIMSMLRFAAKVYSEAIENFVPDGPDKTFVLRNHRANAMWVNIAVTRLADGTPRT